MLFLPAAPLSPCSTSQTRHPPPFQTLIPLFYSLPENKTINTKLSKFPETYSFSFLKKIFHLNILYFTIPPCVVSPSHSHSYSSVSVALSSLPTLSRRSEGHPSWSGSCSVQMQIIKLYPKSQNPKLLSQERITKIQIN